MHRVVLCRHIIITVVFWKKKKVFYRQPIIEYIYSSLKNESFSHLCSCALSHTLIVWANVSDRWPRPHSLRPSNSWPQLLPWGVFFNHNPSSLELVYYVSSYFPACPVLLGNSFLCISSAFSDPVCLSNPCNFFTLSYSLGLSAWPTVLRGPFPFRKHLLF